LGGTDVASDTSAASGIRAALGIVHLSGIFTVGIGNICVAGIFPNDRLKVSLKGETCLIAIACL
jgi:hypothetical protein